MGLASDKVSPMEVGQLRFGVDLGHFRMRKKKRPRRRKKDRLDSKAGN